MLVSTGEALSLLGDQKAAMERFEKALAMPDSDRISVRLAIAQLMATKRDKDGARRQIALALMEAQTGETLPAYRRATDGGCGRIPRHARLRTGADLPSTCAGCRRT